MVLTVSALLAAAANAAPTFRISLVDRLSYARSRALAFVVDLLAGRPSSYVTGQIVVDTASLAFDRLRYGLVLTGLLGGRCRYTD